MTHVAGDNAIAPPGPTTFAGFAMMCLGMFMAILDVQIVATSLPTIQSALGVAPDRMSWVQTAYLIAEIVAIPLTGVLIRLFGMRLLFAVAVLVFTAASAGCAASSGFHELIAWRIVQGFAGGTLIPSVFSAVFLMFPFRLQGAATTVAGVLAVLAPTLGPIAGGWITDAYSWHWLFLVNLVPGLVAALGGWLFLPKRAIAESLRGQVDGLSLTFLVVGLAALEIALKEAPHRGWLSPVILILFAATFVSGIGLSQRARRSAYPLVDVRLLADRNFAIGSTLSFILGVGLFGSVYLMPVFLAYVRGHDAFEIGTVMLVTGLAQLATAPIAVALERRIDARLLTAFGFLLFSAGMALSARQTIDTDFHEMIWPQLLRGSAIMFCLLPPTRLALGHLSPDRVPDASGLFNLMRNLGGAIGLALIDTVIYGQAPAAGEAIVERLKAGDLDTAAAIGLSPDMLAAGPAALGDPAVQAMIAPFVEKAAFVETTNLAWGVIAAISLLTLCLLPLVRKENANPTE